MSDITRYVPIPSPITLGSRAFLASELRVRDLSLMQGFVKAKVPSPFDVAEPFLSGPDRGIAWKYVLAATIDAQKLWPPDLTSEEAQVIFSAPDGRSYFAWIVLRREHLALTHDAVHAILETATIIEYRQLVRVAWAADPMAALMDMVDGPMEPGGEPRDWGKIRHAYCTECVNGPPFEDLTLTQVNAFVGKGELPEPGTYNGPADQYDWEADRRREAFFADANALIEAEREGE